MHKITKLPSSYDQQFPASKIRTQLHPTATTFHQRLMLQFSFYVIQSGLKQEKQERDRYVH